MPADFARLTARQLSELPRGETVFFFPLGPLEDHGPHLPLGLDGWEAERLCRTAAERLEREKPGWMGVVMPAIPLGVSSDTSAIAITVRGYVLRDFLVDACRALVRAEFRHFVCFSGQLGPRQLTAIEDAGKLILWRGPFTWLRALLAPPGSPLKIRPTFASASSAMTTPRQAAEAPLWSDPVEHGGRRDTAVALALGWMDGQPLTASAAAALGLGAKPRPASALRRAWELYRGRRAGSWGPKSPTEATAAEGASVMKDSLDTIFPKLRAVWEGANPNLLFRSWYSIIPPNKSFFKVWLLGFLIFTTMAAWLYLCVQSYLPR